MGGYTNANRAGSQTGAMLRAANPREVMPCVPLKPFVIIRIRNYYDR